MFIVGRTHFVQTSKDDRTSYLLLLLWRTVVGLDKDKSEGGAVVDQEFDVCRDFGECHYCKRFFDHSSFPPLHYLRST